MKLDFNADDHEPFVEFEPIPEGKYLSVIRDSNQVETKKGTGHFLKLEFELIGDNQYKGRKVFDNLNLQNPSGDAVRIAKAKLSSICRAVNVMRPKESCELHDIPLVIDVKLEKRKDIPAGDPPKFSNKIVGYLSRKDASQAAAKNNKAAEPATATAGADKKAPWE